MFRPGKSARADFGGVVGDRPFNAGTERTVALDEFRNARRKAKHVLKHEYLTIARNTSADADGRDYHRSRELARQRFRDRFNDDRKRTRLRNRE